MAYRDERHALEQRASALRGEIDELLDELEGRERALDRQEHEAFWARVGDQPPPAEYLRPSTSDLRPMMVPAGIFGGIFVVIALVADNPPAERLGGLLVLGLFVAIFVGAARLIVQHNRGRSTDVRLGPDGVRLRDDRIDDTYPWPDVERLRLRVDVTSSGRGQSSRVGYLAIRRDGVWSEHVLTGISRSTEAAMQRWIDWVLGVRQPAEPDSPRRPSS